MRLVQRSMMAAGAGLAVAALAGCGSSGKLLSVGQARSLEAELELVSTYAQAHECAEVSNHIGNLEGDIDALQGVNGTLVSNLEQGVSTIRTLSARQCPTTSSPRTSTTTTTTRTSPTTVTSTTLSSTPSSTTTSSTTTSTTAAPPSTTTSVTAPTIPSTTSTAPSGGGGL